MINSVVKCGLWGARGDAGGLAAVTHDFYTHMEPDRTMVIDLGEAGRGPTHMDRYPNAQVIHGYNDAITPDAVRYFCQGLDVVYICETAYREDFCQIARSVGCRTVLHAMPELWRERDAQPDVVWVPTCWELGRMPLGTQVVPVPIDRKRFPDRRLEDPPERWLHMGAPAFHDRAGTRDLVDALALVTEPVRVLFQGGAKPDPIVNRHDTKIEVEWLPSDHVERQDAYPVDVQGLISPRRYGGLSLPLAEAASLGWPIISTDLSPQNDWIIREGLVAARMVRMVRMVAGHFPVYASSLPDLAAAIDRLSTDREAWSESVRASRAYAKRLDWVEWKGRYKELLEEVSAG